MIEELGEQAKELAAQESRLAAEYKSAAEDSSREAAQMQAAQADLMTAKEELIRAEGEDRLISEKLETLSGRLDSLLSEKENANTRIALFKKAYDEAQANAKAVQAQIDDTEKELSGVSDNTRDIQEKREELRLKTEQINLELVTTAKDSQAASLSIEELKLRKSTQSDHVKTVESEILQIEEKNRVLNSEIESIKAQAEKLRERSKQSGAEVESLIERRNESDKRSADLRTLERNKSQEREKLSAEIVRLDERKIAMRKEYDELNDMLFEQYELTRREAEALNIQIENMDQAKRRLHEIKVAIKKLGSINVGAIEEYKEVSERYTFLKEQIDDIEKSKSELLRIIDDLTVSMSEKFMAQFRRINEEFKTCFADFFGGGKGEIILEDPDNCLESQIEIKIQPPGKSVQNINLFSGGEKSLAAMALLFSVLKVTPSPFCIYDEVEAALDDVNVERFAKYMRKMTDKTQFISITHRRGTMEEADVLYGVTMQEKGVSKLLELQSAELAAQMGLDA